MPVDPCHIVPCNPVRANSSRIWPAEVPTAVMIPAACDARAGEHPGDGAKSQSDAGRCGDVADLGCDSCRRDGCCVGDVWGSAVGVLAHGAQRFGRLDGDRKRVGGERCDRVPDSDDDADELKCRHEQGEKPGCADRPLEGRLTLIGWSLDSGHAGTLSTTRGRSEWRARADPALPARCCHRRSRDAGEVSRIRTCGVSPAGKKDVSRAGE
jgi:hypothetical protein